ncbi:MAG: hypothetical protein V4787_11520 [Pseudomonadota bacterium]
MSNIFESATRSKLRFTSVRGQLSVEDLWDLPLTSKTGFDLDTVAKTVNATLKAQAEESFVATSTNPAKAVDEQKLEIVKHVIAMRIAENETRRSAAARKEQREKLQAVLADKLDGKMREQSVEELQAQLAALSDA